MKPQGLFLVLIVCSWILAACQSDVVPMSTPMPAPSDTAAPTPTSIPPSDTPVPTNTSAPTETAKPTTTSLPEGILFRDDFEGALQPGWEWENENPAKWTITNDGWLKITGERNSLLTGGKQSNLLWYPLPDGDFVISVHLRTKTWQNFHQAAIYIYEDPDNYITLNRGYCDLCLPGGNGFFMDYKIGGQLGTYKKATSAEDVYLRLESKNNVISGYYATAPDQWERLGASVISFSSKT